MNSTKTTPIELYKYEKPLFWVAFVISLLAWVGLIIGTYGVIFVFLGLFFIAYLFGQSRFVSYLKGTGALVSSNQFPEVQRAVESCAARVGLEKTPSVFILHMNGMFNAFALKFLRRSYIVLLSDIVDALDNHPDALNFYIGHEMGHIHRNHTTWEVFLAPALILPLLGAGYSRAREYTCDKYGHACCANPESSRLGLAALGVGGKKFAELSSDSYLYQVKETKGFWMSFHEIISSYPWLVKRYARVSSSENLIPSRNPFAYLFAIFIPRLSIMTFVIIYLVIIIASGVMSGKSMLGGITPNAAVDTSYNQTYDNYESSEPQPDYKIGEKYDNGAGIFFEYLGGDPIQPSSWKEIGSMEVSPDSNSNQDPDTQPSDKVN